MDARIILALFVSLQSAILDIFFYCNLLYSFRKNRKTEKTR